jgi:tol-pal system protein YbgF
MKFKWIVLSLATLAISGCGGSVSDQRTIDELNYQVSDLQGAAEKAEIRLAELESTNVTLEEQNEKLMLLKKKMEINAEYIEELRNSAFEIKPPDDLKIVRLSQNNITEDGSGTKSSRVKKFSSIPKKSTGSGDGSAVMQAKSTPAPAEVVEPAPTKVAEAAPPAKEEAYPSDEEEAAPAEASEESFPNDDEEALAAPTPGVVVLKDESADTETAMHATADDLSGGVEELYQKGLDANFAGEYEKSREIFSMLLVKFPNHSLADNALYWSGETYFSSKEYQKAIKKFTEVVKRYPKENKTPDALLKAGYSFLELEKPENAKKILEKVISLYPDTEAAARAQEKLAEL